MLWERLITCHDLTDMGIGCTKTTVLKIIIYLLYTVCGVCVAINNWGIIFFKLEKENYQYSSLKWCKLSSLYIWSIPRSSGVARIFTYLTLLTPIRGRRIALYLEVKFWAGYCTGSFQFLAKTLFDWNDEIIKIVT